MLNVIEDTHVSGSDWKYDFTDGSSVVVREHHDTSPPHLSKVSGEFTQERLDAIKKYSFLEVK